MARKSADKMTADELEKEARRLASAARQKRREEAAAKAELRRARMAEVGEIVVAHFGIDAKTDDVVDRVLAALTRPELEHVELGVEGEPEPHVEGEWRDEGADIHA